jgi:hypothetical protein
MILSLSPRIVASLVKQLIEFGKQVFCMLKYGNHFRLRIPGYEISRWEYDWQNCMFARKHPEAVAQQLS